MALVSWWISGERVKKKEFNKKREGQMNVVIIERAGIRKENGNVVWKNEKKRELKKIQKIYKTGGGKENGNPTICT